MRPFSALEDEDDRVDRVRYLLYGEKRSVERVMQETGLSRQQIAKMAEAKVGRRIDKNAPPICTVDELQAHALVLLDATMRYGGNHFKDKRVKFPGADVLARRIGVDPSYLKKAIAGTAHAPIRAASAELIMRTRPEDVTWQPEPARVAHLIECRRDKRASRLIYAHGDKFMYARFMVERFGWPRYDVANVLALSHRYVARIFEAVLAGPDPIPLLRDDLVALVPQDLDGKASHG